MKITVYGIGYVGLSNAILLSQAHSVTAVDRDPARVAQVNARQSPIEDVLNVTPDLSRSQTGSSRLRAQQRLGLTR